jgi:hypothetical protein
MKLSNYLVTNILNLWELNLETLNGILTEELSRLKSLQKIYEHNLCKLPRGCLIAKEIKGQIYYYLNYREGKKSIFKYLGKLSNEDIFQIKNKIEERRKLKSLYAQAKKNINKIEKMSYGKKE